MDESNIFWKNNFNIIIDKNKVLQFFPNKNYSLEENLNSIVRLSLYLSIVLSIYSKNIKYSLLFLVSLPLTFLLYDFYKNKESLTFNNTEKKNNKKIIPTVDNPFMNFNYITDKYDREEPEKAFLYDDNKSDILKKDISEKFNEKLYRDVGDLYSKRNSQREFFSIPYNGIPDQTSFAKWLYKTPGATCKENGLKCGSYTGSME